MSLAMAIPFPDIDPVAFEIGPVQIRWYALAYLTGFLAGWRYCLSLVSRQGAQPNPNKTDIDDFLPWAIAGVILGGRIGYILFYNFGSYLSAPTEILKLWHGGMSFHGGLVGVIIALVVFSRRRGFPVLHLADLLACVAPIGLFFGRLANFINGELFGRTADVPWAVVFPRGGPEPRHPSQLYESALEGMVLFAVLFVLARRPEIRARPGFLSGVFLAGYAMFRFLVEFFREPDIQIGYLLSLFTMGQVLCLPMFAVGVALIGLAIRRESAAPRRESFSP